MIAGRLARAVVRARRLRLFLRQVGSRGGRGGRRGSARAPRGAHRPVAGARGRPRGVGRGRRPALRTRGLPTRGRNGARRSNSRGRRRTPQRRGCSGSGCSRAAGGRKARGAGRPSVRKRPLDRRADRAGAPGLGGRGSGPPLAGSARVAVGRSTWSRRRARPTSTPITFSTASSRRQSKT